LEFVGCGKLLDQLVSYIAVLGVGFAMFGKKFNIARTQSVVVLESLEESAAGQLIREFVAAVRRCHLLKDMIAAQRDIQPAHPR
jgi:hypothetical protein